MVVVVTVYTLEKNMTAMFLIVNYYKYKFISNVHKMNQFYQIDDIIHNLNLIISIINIIDVIHIEWKYQLLFM